MGRLGVAGDQDRGPRRKELNAPAYPEERIFKSVFAERWCEEGSENALQRARIGYLDLVLQVDGRFPPLSGERSSEFYGCNDVS